jgi:acetolactate decarboxylase
MSILHLARIYLFALLVSSGLLCATDGYKTLVQWSTIDAVLNGYYTKIVSLEEVAKHGDFGIGTLEHLDGEMILLNGIFYQIDAKGKVYKLDASVQTPFAAVTFFQPDIEVIAPEGLSLEALQDWIDQKLPSLNYFYAIRIEGDFPVIRTRSVAKQTQPYPPLIEVVKTQSVFEFSNTQGVLAGFRCPPYAKAINVPGYHFHYLADNMEGGGHLLGLTTGANTKIQISTLRHFSMYLPADPHFGDIDFQQDRTKELHEAETERR